MMLQGCHRHAVGPTLEEVQTNLGNNDLMVEFVVHADSDGILPAYLQYPAIARRDRESYRNKV